MKAAGWKQATTNEAQLDIPVLFFFSCTSITVLLIPLVMSKIIACKHIYKSLYVKLKD